VIQLPCAAVYLLCLRREVRSEEPGLAQVATPGSHRVRTGTRCKTRMKLRSGGFANCWTTTPFHDCLHCLLHCRRYVVPVVRGVRTHARESAMRIDKDAVKKGVFITGGGCPAITKGIEPVRFGQQLSDLHAIRLRINAARARLDELVAVRKGKAQ